LSITGKIVDSSLFEQGQNALADLAMSYNAYCLVWSYCLLVVQKIDNSLRSLRQRLAARGTKLRISPK
jgi:hypothetical protein